MSRADVKRGGLPYIINKLNNLGFSEKELKNLSYQERGNLLNNNPVLLAGQFQFKVEVFSKEIALDGALGKTKYYARCIEFQERSSPHVHLYGFLMNQILKMKLLTLSLLKKTINAQFLDHLSNQELFRLS